jgi:phosphoglycerate dehydrogenase-like enzyme
MKPAARMQNDRLTGIIGLGAIGGAIRWKRRQTMRFRFI